MNDAGGMEVRGMQMTANANEGGREGTQTRAGEQWRERIWHAAAAPLAAATQQLQPQRRAPVSTTQKRAHPHLVGQNRVPAARFLVFLAQSPPLTRHRIASPCHITSDVHHPDWVPTTQIPAHPHSVSQNQAPAARILAFWP